MPEESVDKKPFDMAQAARETYMKLISRYVRPHRKVSREITAFDMERVKTEADIMFALCNTPIGRHTSAIAIAHPQIDYKDPLRFFVTFDRRVVINPKITRHTAVPVQNMEGCMTFNTFVQIPVSRWRKMEVEFQYIMEDGSLSAVVTSEVDNVDAFMFQHEIDHLDGKYVYDERLTKEEQAKCFIPEAELYEKGGND